MTLLRRWCGALHLCFWAVCTLASFHVVHVYADADPTMVSPIVNRELESSVVAHSWPFTVHNIFCEAWAFHQQDESWSFLDDLVENVLQQGDIAKLSSSSSSNADTTKMDVVRATQLVLQATEHSGDKSYLEYALSLRAYSPQCELHRGLARQVALQEHLQSSQEESTEKTSLDAFAVVYPSGDTVSDPDEMDDALSNSAVEDFPVVPTDTLLPGETPRATANGESKPLVILYANIGSESFVHFYTKLVKKNVQFVVRHMGAIDFEENGGSPTILQGYGVRVDIRNVEYRAFDEAPRGSESVKELVDPSSAKEIVSDASLAGVNLTVVTEGLSPEEALDIQQKLWKRHGAQQLHSQTIPPTWQRRELSLQAAAVIAKSTSSDKDPLLTLQDVSQNLPSVASTLVHVQVPDDIADIAEALTDVPLFRGAKGAAVMINGRRVSVDRPSFNVFEMLNLLRKEQRELKDMQSYLNSYMDLTTMQKVQDIWAMGEDAFQSEDMKRGGMEDDGASSVFRIDVGRGWKNSVVYLNDVEKDRQYAQWPQQLQQMLYGMQFGQPPAVRRNLFTVLAVVDPVAVASNAGLDMGLQLTNQMYPIRMGVLFVSQRDIESCNTWIVENSITDEDAPCPVSPLFEMSGKPHQTDLQGMKASTQAVYKLLSYISSLNSDAVWPLNYAAAMLGLMDEFMASNPLTMDSLLTIHSDILTSLGNPNGIPSGIDILLSGDDNDSPSYGKAVRFAVKKSLLPGMSFVNGRPLPTEEEEQSREKAGKIFMEERNHIFQMIHKQEITDRSPKSVYAKLLSGGGVFKRVHPLLTGSNQKKYIRLSHDFDTGSLMFPETTASVPKEDADAVFVVEVALELDTDSGIDFASSLISIMNEYPTSVGDDQNPVRISVAYRFLPSTKASVEKPLYKILRHAGHFHVSTLLSLFQLGKEGKSLSEMLESATDIDAEVKKSIASTNDSSESTLQYLENSLPSRNFVIANGRAYFPQTPVISKDDIDLLLDMDIAKNKAVTKLLKPHLTGNEKYHDAISKASAFLFEQDGSSQREDACGDIVQIEQESQLENPLRFEWNNDQTEELKVKVCAIIDPLSEATQRATPLLRAFRDQLQLPLSLAVVPRILLDGDDDIPITSYYRFVAEPNAIPDLNPPRADFSHLPANHLLTLQLDVPEPWIVIQTQTVQDTDNLRCDVNTGCSDEAHTGDTEGNLSENQYLTRVEYGLTGLSFFGQCYDSSSGSPPNGLQLTLSEISDLGNKSGIPAVQEIEIGADGTTTASSSSRNLAIGSESAHYSDTLVMKTVGYWQLRANPGVWKLEISKNSRGAEIFDIVDGSIKYGKFKVDPNTAQRDSKTLVMKDFVSSGELLLVKRRPGFETASLFYDEPGELAVDQGEVINVFSLATGHLYERFLKIMMLSVTKRTSSKVKFWLFENFLSPSFKASAIAMAERIGCEVEFVTYKWPEWLRGQSEKQRIIWGYKILFLDVLFPLDVKKIIYVDADQVIRGDLKELWDMDLQGAPYGYTPMCSSRESTLGYAFWRTGFWKSHLQDKPYHISALYVVDLEKFRRDLVGDKLRSVYQQLSADPNSLSNLDQDLPNYAQHQVPIFSLPQEWLWCESWCSDETKPLAKTIDLCNNPLHKEAKLSMAKRVISGDLFEESWEELDAEVEKYNLEFQESIGQ